MAFTVSFEGVTAGFENATGAPGAAGCEPGVPPCARGDAGDADFDPVSYINEPRWRTSRLGLERMAELLDAMGRPQDRLSFVHVAGTNGKGSTCAYLSSILRAAGYRTGLFTSPFIETFEERICVDGEMISPDELRDATLAVRECAERMDDHPTEFELMCAVALEHFARTACDIVVLEVGLGGRFDATNVIDRPEVSVIARIGLDHEALLGSDIAAIAREKAGIVKGAPVVSWPQEPAARDVIERVCADQGVPVRYPDFSALTLEEVDLNAYAGGGDRAPLPLQHFSYKDLGDLSTQLLARYQPFNAALAIEAVGALRDAGWSIPDEALRRGLARAHWPGRFEVADVCPLFIVDGGHNPQGACALAETLRDVLPGARPVFLLSVLADKDYRAMIDELVPLASGFVVTASENPRALSADALAQAVEDALDRRARVVGAAAAGEADAGAAADGAAAGDAGEAARRVPVVRADRPRQAVRLAREMAGAEGVVCACGSLYTIGAIKAALR